MYVPVFTIHMYIPDSVYVIYTSKYLYIMSDQLIIFPNKIHSRSSFKNKCTCI